LHPLFVIEQETPMKNAKTKVTTAGISLQDRLRSFFEKRGDAKFDSDWLSVKIEGDGKGHFHAMCTVFDEPAKGDQLKFAVDFDQTELPEILRGLAILCEAIPVEPNENLRERVDRAPPIRHAPNPT
jgi:hypothetical protein